MRRVAPLLVAAMLSVTACDEAEDPAPAGEGGSGPVEDVTLDPPAPGEGFQLGTPAFPIAAGEEVQNCYFVRVPGEVGGPPIFVKRIVLAQNPGTHHGNLFRVKTVQGLGTPEQVERGFELGGECWKSSNWADWPLIINSQESTQNEDIDWTLPEGVAHRFEPGELIAVQSHYVNATTQASPGNGKMLVNFYTTPESEVRDELGTLFTTNQNILVCPGETDKEYTQSCNFAQGQPVTVVAANGHFHSRGVRFDMSTYDSTTGEAGELFYTSLTWDDPPMARDLNVPIPQDGGISWTCTFTAPAGTCGNPDKECCFDFGGKVESSEHCNVFLYYYPKVRDAGCF